MLKRIIATVLVFVTLIGLMPMLPVANMTAEALTNSEVTDKITSYKNSIYPQDYYWCDGGKGNLNTSYSYSKCGSSNCKCNSFGNGWQCFAFALHLGNKLFGSYPTNHRSSSNGTISNGWRCYTGSGLNSITLEPGDIVAHSGHTAVVWKTVSGATYFAECWGGQQNKINYKWGYNGSSSCNTLSGIKSKYGTVYVWKYQNKGNVDPPQITTVSIPTGNYQLKNKSTGTYLTVDSNKDTNNQNISVAKNTSASGQKYYIYPQSGSFGMRPHCSSSSQRVVNVSTPEVVSSGNNVMLWERTNHSSQLWKFESLGNNEYVIRSANDLTCALTASSGNVIVKTYSGSNAQKWVIESLDKYTVKYDANGGSGAPSAHTVEVGETVTLSNTIPSRLGYTFLGWANGNNTTVAYLPNESFKPSGNVTLYAVWKQTTISADSTVITPITYDGQMYMYKFVPSTSASYGIYSTNSGDTRVYLFDADGNEIASNDDADGINNRNFRLVYELTADTTYYYGVKYYSSSDTGNISVTLGKLYYVSYNANGGTGAPSSQSEIYGQSLTMSDVKPTRSGYSFTGWYTAASGGTEVTSLNTISANTTLYAQWSRFGITSQPTNITAASGATISTKVVAEGDGLTYQWYYKNADASSYTKSSVTSATYSSTMYSNWNGRQMYCKVTDKYGNSVTSNVITFTISNPVKITTQPTAVKAASGAQISTKVVATGDGLTYAWYYKNAGDSSYTKSSITSATYSSTMYSNWNGRQMYCKVTDKYGNSVTSNVITFTISNPVKITTQPTAVKAASGAQISTKVVATGDGLTYAWYYKNAGASSYTKSSITSATYSSTMYSNWNGRLMYCKVTDKYGNSVTSNVITFTISNSLKITTQPTAVKAASGAKISTKVVATGDGLTYQWYYKNAGASSYTKSSVTSATYSTTMQSNWNGRKMYCKVTDKYGNSVNSNAITFTLNGAVKITTQTTSVKAVSGAKISVNVAASGDGLTYQWYYKNADASSYSKSSVTSATYSDSMKSTWNGRKMYCKVTDKYGNSVNSDVITFTLSD